MKTTVEVSDDLYRRAKSEAALRGRRLRDLVEEGLRIAVEVPPEPQGRQSLGRLMKSMRGVVDLRCRGPRIQSQISHRLWSQWTPQSLTLARGRISRPCGTASPLGGRADRGVGAAAAGL